MKNRNSGFTLVEIIVVVVILAILAAMLVPGFVRYLTEGNDEKNYRDAYEIMMSADTEFKNLYASYSHNKDNNSIDPDTSGNQSGGGGKNRDCDMRNKKVSDTILQNVGINKKLDYPHCIVIITGDYQTYAADPIGDFYDPVKAYTVYAIIFEQYFERGYFVMFSDGRVVYPHSLNGTDSKKIGITTILKDMIVDDEGNSIVPQLYYLKAGKDNTAGPNTAWNSYIYKDAYINKNNGKKDTKYDYFSN